MIAFVNVNIKILYRTVPPPGKVPQVATVQSIVPYGTVPKVPYELPYGTLPYRKVAVSLGDEAIGLFPPRHGTWDAPYSTLPHPPFCFQGYAHKHAPAADVP